MTAHAFSVSLFNNVFWFRVLCAGCHSWRQRAEIIHFRASSFPSSTMKHKSTGYHSLLQWLSNASRMGIPNIQWLITDNVHKESWQETRLLKVTKFRRLFIISFQLVFAPCGFLSWNNRPTPFPGQMV